MDAAAPLFAHYAGGVLTNGIPRAAAEACGWKRKCTRLMAGQGCCRPFSATTFTIRGTCFMTAAVFRVSWIGPT